MRVFIIKTIIVTILTCLGVTLLKTMDHTTLVSVAGVISTISGILFGFVLASISVLGSSSHQNGIVDALKKNNCFSELIDGLLSTGITLITACLFTLISMFLPNSNTGISWDFLFVLVGFFFLLISIVTFLFSWRRLSWIFPHM
ncbi:hypothetical protein [Xenorhabdus sp. PB62.4]|uniref:hypothetical protein n=1 Tax=Xenorhabdus sp. PB62.4 TaxID=1851573 RepID=UPI00165753C3|nr:hypothetical protein [Xenorhabdus sp. PB62.4]MBC8954945.1 hypothetical protein [Xenorhabdus sp. PB62.4]